MTGAPSRRPSRAPSASGASTQNPTRRPTKVPSRAPSRAPSSAPSRAPSSRPTSGDFTQAPTRVPTKVPSKAPSAPSYSPSRAPSSRPTSRISTQAPTRVPTNNTYIVVGAGMSGLAAAKKLAGKYGASNVLILEGRSRTGGRVKTVDIGTSGAKIDVGASWIHGIETNPLYPIATSLNLQVWYEGTCLRLLIQFDINAMVFIAWLQMVTTNYDSQTIYRNGTKLTTTIVNQVRQNKKFPTFLMFSPFKTVHDIYLLYRWARRWIESLRPLQMYKRAPPPISLSLRDWRRPFLRPPTFR